MALTLPDLPDGVAAALSAGVPELLGRSAQAFDASVDAVRPALGHRVYVASLHDAASGLDVRAATPLGWRAVVLAGEEPSGTVDVADEGDGDPRVTMLSRGGRADGLLSAVGAAEDADEAESASLELRELEIPALHLRALWLHGDDDRFVPIAPAPHGLEADRVYEAAEFVEAARDIARGMLEKIEEAGGGVVS